MKLGGEHGNAAGAAPPFVMNSSTFYMEKWEPDKLDGLAAFCLRTLASHVRFRPRCSKSD
jgi:hypothetical protein